MKPVRFRSFRQPTHSHNSSSASSFSRFQDEQLEAKLGSEKKPQTKSVTKNHKPKEEEISSIRLGGV